MPALPFPLPAVTPAFAALTPAARGSGRSAAARASASLSEQLGVPVEISGRPLAGPAAPALGTVHLGLEFATLPAQGAVEVEASLAARLVDLLAGGEGGLPAATTLAPIEQAGLELLALVALSGVAGDQTAAGPLGPRLSRATAVPGGALSVDLSVSAGGVRGGCRLLLPAEVVRAVGGPGDLVGPLASFPVDGWVASGWASLAEGELRALSPGDVILLDEAPSPAVELRLPGLRLAGRSEDGQLHLEKIMTETAAQLPFTVAVEVARVSLTLAELAALEPGAAFPLHAPRDGRVTLRLGERTMAHGHLVEIEGALGVRIDRLEAAS